MKKHLRLTLTNFALIVLLTVSLMTSNAMCNETCLTGGTSGTITGTATITNNQNTTLESDFNYRDNANGTADFELTSFTYWSLLLPKYYDSPQFRFIFAMSYALTYLFPDTTFNGNVTIHFATCWKTETTLLQSNPDYYRETISPCNYDNCCSVTFSRLVDQYGYTRLDLVSENFGNPVECPTSPYSCDNVCNTDFWPENLIEYWPYGPKGAEERFIRVLPSPGSPTRKNSGVNLIQNENSISVQPNPAQDKLNITFIMPENGNYSYSIYDYQGSFIESININITAGISNYTLDLTKYCEGVYFIKSNEVGSATKAAPFVIIK